MPSTLPNFPHLAPTSEARARRRTFLTWMAAAAATSPMAALAQTSAADAVAPVRLGAKLRMVIPANAGGGWDQTGRAMGAALVANGNVDAIDYENVGGKGGVLGLEHYVKNYDGDANAMLMGGMVMVGAVALHKPAVNLSHVSPLARLTSDYMVLVVRGDSPIRTTKDLVALMKTDLRAVPIAGASAGSVDHMFIGRLVRAAPANPAELAYQPFAGGAQVTEAVLSGKAVAAISGYSELKDMLASGKLRAIGVSSRRALYGIPSVREQGLDIDMANWRGLFTGRQVPAARQADMVKALQGAVAHASWQGALKQNRWQSSWMAGSDLVAFLETERAIAEVMVHILKLKA